MELDVGARLRLVRMRHGLSQRELARRAGVTNATVSLIESNKVNPSVGALKRVLDGVPMGLAEFFSLEPIQKVRHFYDAADLVEIGKGKISFRQVGEQLAERSLQILKERYEPGADTGRVPLGRVRKLMLHFVVLRSIVSQLGRWYNSSRHESRGAGCGLRPVQRRRP